jgi:mannitol-specific phosphotransferase system IIBC component
MLEGSRAFDIAWGSITGLICFSLGLAALYLWVRARRTGAASIFGAASDPGRGLQLAWGIFAMGMGGTNVGCRYIDHRYLSGVHEGFFALTLLVVAVLVPALAARAARTVRADSRRAHPA